MIVNQESLRGLNVSYSTAFNKALESVKEDYKKFATTVPSSAAENRYPWIGQMPQMREWIGDREIQNLSAYDYAIKNRKFEMTVSVPRDTIEDDQYGTYSMAFSHMGTEAAHHPEKLCFEVLKNGFKEKCYDGKAFFAEDHPSGEGGKTKAGNLSHLKLGTDAYVEARTSMMLLKGDRGKSLGLVPDLLVVSPANEHAARMILEADQISGTTNIWKGTAELLVSTELADTPEAWFLFSTKSFLKPLIFQQRKPWKLVAKNREEDDNVFTRDEFLWGASNRCNAGYGFWQMAYGSDGTVAAQG
jgi:phage major head subunit gpT-like protein